jgi:hypothetical protein
MLEDGPPRQIAGRQLTPLFLAGAPGPEVTRIGIQAENELRLALRNPGGEDIPKRSRRRQRPFTALFKPLPAVKRGTREAAI